MKIEKVTGRPISNLLYPKESPESQERTKGELATPDPKPEKVLDILSGVTPKPEKDNIDNESQSS